MKKIVAISALVLSFSFSQVPLAYADGMCWEHGSRIEKLADKLDLSADQRMKIKAIRADAKQKMVPIHQEMRAVREKVNEAFQTNSLNMMKQHSLLSEEKDVIGSALKLRMHERAEIAKVLTEAQRVKLISMVKAWKEKHEKHHKKHH